MKMKKLLSLGLTLTAAISLASCANLPTKTEGEGANQNNNNVKFENATEPEKIKNQLDKIVELQTNSNVSSVQLEEKIVAKGNYSEISSGNAYYDGATSKTEASVDTDVTVKYFMSVDQSKIDSTTIQDVLNNYKQIYNATSFNVSANGYVKYNSLYEVNSYNSQEIADVVLDCVLFNKENEIFASADIDASGKKLNLKAKVDMNKIFEYADPVIDAYKEQLSQQLPSQTPTEEELQQMLDTYLSQVPTEYLELLETIKGYASNYNFEDVCALFGLEIIDGTNDVQLKMNINKTNIFNKTKDVIKDILKKATNMPEEAWPQVEEIISTIPNLNFDIVVSFNKSNGLLSGLSLDLKELVNDVYKFIVTMYASNGSEECPIVLNAEKLNYSIKLSYNVSVTNPTITDAVDFTDDIIAQLDAMLNRDLVY